jgi:AbrB family looped-hinge helix DNA binding protein
MKATIDKAGRLVVPKEFRDRLGLAAGEVELSLDGAALRVEAVAREDLVERDGLVIIPPAGEVVTADAVRSLRESDQH